MWSYYGAKTNIVDRYPAPVHQKIIEPFAGSARYALKYWDREVILMDRYPIVIEIWKWLQKCSAGDILSMPTDVKPGDLISDLMLPCREAALLYGFITGKGLDSPARKATSFGLADRPKFLKSTLKRISETLPKIKHWDIRLGSYEQLDNENASWFIDPPYQDKGKHYPKSARNINFSDLAEWCRSRSGQVIVCEGPAAKWLPFTFFARVKGRAGFSTEMMYYQENNKEKHYQASQLSLFPNLGK